MSNVVQCGDSIFLGADKSLTFLIPPTFVLIKYFYHIKVYCFVYVWPKFHNCNLII
jgi:hypothetical protein